MTEMVFQHRTVMLDEAVDALNIRPDGVYVDGTFGRGGHSRLILSRLGPQGRLIAFDKDPQAIAEAEAITDARFQIVHQGFAALSEELERLGVAAVDGVLLDLGISSPQIDNPERGFSFRFDAPLDMRMDTTRGRTAADWLATAEENEIAAVIKDYGEERFAKQIARTIVAARTERPITTTRELAQIVATCVRTREPGQDPATRTFQAIRIFINQELEELEIILPQIVRRLSLGGRLSIISFHSLEDRIVKQFVARLSQPIKLPSRLPVRAADLPQPALRLVGKGERASVSEVAANPRARSAMLRVAERTEGPCSV